MMISVGLMSRLTHSGRLQSLQTKVDYRQLERYNVSPVEMELTF